MKIVHCESYASIDGNTVEMAITRHCIGTKAEYYAFKAMVNGVVHRCHTGKSASYVYDKMNEFAMFNKKA